MVYIRSYTRGGVRVKGHQRKGSERKLRQIKSTNVVFVKPGGQVQVRTMVPKMRRKIVIGGKVRKVSPGTRGQKLIDMTLPRGARLLKKI
jgi:hypothetical protein